MYAIEYAFVCLWIYDLVILNNILIIHDYINNILKIYFKIKLIKLL